MLMSGSDAATLSPVAQFNKTGFETNFTLPTGSQDAYIAVAAYSKTVSSFLSGEIELTLSRMKSLARLIQWRSASLVYEHRLPVGHKQHAAFGLLRSVQLNTDTMDFALI